MSDERLRDLERQAAAGDAAAQEALYWTTLRTIAGAEVLDRLVESVIKLENKGNKVTPTAAAKLAFIRGEAVVPLTAAETERRRARYRSIRHAKTLHVIPRDVRQPGFTTYCDEDGGVYRYGQDHQWARICQLSAPPPYYPIHVVDTLAQRDSLEAGPRETCLVLANGGVYVSGIKGNKYSDATTITWHSVRFEKRTGV